MLFIKSSHLINPLFKVVVKLILDNFMNSFQNEPRSRSGPHLMLLKTFLLFLSPDLSQNVLSVEDEIVFFALINLNLLASFRNYLLFFRILHIKPDVLLKFGFDVMLFVHGREPILRNIVILRCKKGLSISLPQLMQIFLVFFPGFCLTRS